MPAATHFPDEWWRAECTGQVAATIVFFEEDAPGITRRKTRGGWAYHDPDGTRITDRDEIDRLNAIALPPAYRDAWFCPDGTGHIQAVGWDEKGRKQYRYHIDYRAQQEAAKYDLCAPFGRALTRVRAQVERDLARRAHSKDRTVAAVVKLLDIAALRVGNETYARTNKSFGLTTLRDRHAEIHGSTLKLEYKAKSGKHRKLRITDRSLARFVKKCQDLPGQKLFQYVGDDGAPHAVTSSDVNAYLRAAMGDGFTAKHFRTWGASVVAFGTLATATAPIGLKAVLEPVVAHLDNTPAIARKSYVHPALIELARDKAAQAAFRQTVRLPRATRYLSRIERGLIAFLDTCGACELKAA